MLVTFSIISFFCDPLTTFLILCVLISGMVLLLTLLMVNFIFFPVASNIQIRINACIEINMGKSEDIITELSRFSDITYLRVIQRSNLKIPQVIQSIFVKSAA